MHKSFPASFSSRAAIQELSQFNTLVLVIVDSVLDLQNSSYSVDYGRHL